MQFLYKVHNIVYFFIITKDNKIKSMSSNIRKTNSTYTNPLLQKQNKIKKKVNTLLSVSRKSFPKKLY